MHSLTIYQKHTHTPIGPMTSGLFVHVPVCVSSTSPATYWRVCVSVTGHCSCWADPIPPGLAGGKINRGWTKGKPWPGSCCQNSAWIHGRLPSSAPSIHLTIRPSIHPSLCQCIFHLSINHLPLPSIFHGAMGSFTGSSLSNSIILTTCKVHMVQWSGVLFCSVNALNPSTSISAKTTLS